MAAELVLAQQSEQDISDAYDWYETRRHGLGEEFLSCVDAIGAQSVYDDGPDVTRTAYGPSVTGPT